MNQNPAYQRLSERWTSAKKERAYAIVNDIAEDIDNKESRKELRQALAVYADLLSDEQHRRTTNASELTFKKIESLIRKIKPTQKESEQ